MTEAFRERLRRLRRDAAAAPEPELAPATAGDFATRTTERPVASRHGAFRLDEAFCADTEAFALLTGDAALGDADLARAVWLDTETTGLGGGAGTYVFMVGLGRFDGDAFRVWQGFLRDPSDERALLGDVAQRVHEADLVVSFFGKSFDRHRLEDKMRIAGIESPFVGRPHLDLYHPLARLVRGTVPDTRLCTLESILCGVERVGDLPGAFAPQAWFDYLAGRPHRLEAVFRHNLDDVLSLVTLAAYLGSVLREQRAGGEVIAGCRIARARAIARSYVAACDRAAALPWLAGAAESRELAFLRADCLRRLGRDGEAREAFEAFVAAPDDEWTAPALIEYAKLLEHRVRDTTAALACTRRAHALGSDCAARLARLVRAEDRV